MTSSIGDVLLDTSVLVGFFNDRDAHHDRAIRILEGDRHFFITTGVFHDTMNVLTRRMNKRAAINAGRSILRSKLEWVFPTHGDLQNAWKAFDTNTSLSFTDASLAAVLNTLHLDAIATFDEEFEKLGVPVLS